MHILYGDDDDPDSGGHLHGTNRPDKTEFPPDWDEERIAREVASLADDPDRAAQLPDGNWVVFGLRDTVTIQAYVNADGRIAAGYPVSGPGVKRNPPPGGA